MNLFGQIGERCVVDPTAEEEACSLVSVVLAVTEKGRCVTTLVRGEGSLHEDTLIDMLKVSHVSDIFYYH
ncbi:hypothetical protein [Microcystis aeruginosa]|uniref:hypothetical protein n=1 Tax=Microcystis aeruginosa TaxID=1126 RepID=UPI0009BF12B0